MSKRKYMSVMICISFFSVLFLPGLVKNVHAQGEKGSAVEGKSEEASVKKTFSEEKREFKRKADERLRELDKEIGELEAESEKAGTKVREEANEGLRDLKHKRSELGRDMRRLGAKSRKDWETVRKKVDAAIGELEESYNKVRDKFKSE